MKHIVFLSANDFKGKSIQVILNTPVAYAENEWKVTYIVARDNSKKSSYFYESEINPKGITTIRFEIPFKKIDEKIKSKGISLLFSKVRYWLTIFKLCKILSGISKTDEIDIVYGYEVHGVLAAKLFKLFSFKRANSIKRIKYVNRFQGTFMYEYLTTRNYKKLLIRLEDYIALKIKADLIIMTNDGTKGDEALRYLGNETPMLFLVNGVNQFELKTNDIYRNIKEKYNIQNQVILLSVSRLVGWKRVDNNIKIIQELVIQKLFTNIKYLIVGEGAEKDNLVKLAKELNVERYIEFVGAISHTELGPFYDLADYFLSTYEGSNVGNPLLEAMLAEKIVFTLNNGDTKRWIINNQNGFIYNENTDFIKEIASDLVSLELNPMQKNKLLESIKKENRNKLWSWKERMEYEMENVKKLID